MDWWNAVLETKLDPQISNEQHTNDKAEMIVICIETIREHLVVFENIIFLKQCYSISKSNFKHIYKMPVSDVS